MSEPYCGIGNIPKGSKRGTMKECMEMGQVRYYGIKMIDSKLVDAAKKSKNVVQDRKILINRKIKLTAQAKKLLDKANVEKNKDVKSEMKEEVRGILVSLRKVKDKLAIADKEVNKIKQRDTKKEEKRLQKKETQKKIAARNARKKSKIKN